jgi:ankyrin repeat protein
MPPPELPLELLLMIARHIRDGDGQLRSCDFNSFLQVNYALYANLNRILWLKAAMHKIETQRVFAHLIKTNNLARLEFFLELGADVEVRLPAIDVTCTGFKPIIGDNCECGREPFDIEPTPLLIAVDLDNIPITRLLLEKGAKVQYLRSYRLFGNGAFSPLHAARSAEMVQLLMDHDADPDWVDELDQRPLHWYAIRGDIAAMREVLLYGAEVSPMSVTSKPLHDAAQHSLDAVKLLIEHGANVEERDVDTNTPLLLAALEGKIDVVRFLVERWPECIRTANEYLQTPLHFAVIEQKEDVIEFLAEQWPEGVREKSIESDTPLHHAVVYGSRPEVVGLLVEGCPEAIKEKDQAGNTPLHLAARSAKTEVVRVLAERWPEGGEVPNNDEKTPLSMFKASFRRRLITDEDKKEIITLLGGRYSEANND